MEVMVAFWVFGRGKIGTWDVGLRIRIMRTRSDSRYQTTDGTLDRLHNIICDVFSPEYKANTSRRTHFSADAIANTSSNIRLYTAFAMH
jgi:hypothetical protein